MVARSPSDERSELAAAPSDGSLHVREFGAGAPLLFVHGIASSNGAWGRSFDALGEQFRVLAVDLLGFGQSPKPDADYTADQHATFIERTLDERQVNGACLLVGHSLGALICLRLLRRDPERYSGAVLVAPPIYADEATARRRIAGIGFGARLFALDHIGARVACQLMCRFPALVRVGQRLAHVDGAISGPAPHTWNSYSRSLRAVVLSGSAAGDLAELTQPVIVVIGTDDQVVDVEFVASIADSNPQVEVEFIAGAAHALGSSRIQDACIAAILRITQQT